MMLQPRRLVRGGPVIVGEGRGLVKKHRDPGLRIEGILPRLWREGLLLHPIILLLAHHKLLVGAIHTVCRTPTAY